MPSRITAGAQLIGGTGYDPETLHPVAQLRDVRHADVAVLSQDIFTVPVDELPGTESVLTVVGGEVVHSSGAVIQR